MMEKEGKLYWTTVSFREDVPIGRATLYRWLKDPTFPVVKVGSRYLIPKAEALAWLNKQKGGKYGKAV